VLAALILFGVAALGGWVWRLRRRARTKPDPPPPVM
jgi:hypothetical protein